MRKDRFTEEFRADAAAESDVDLVWVVRNNLIKSALQRLQRHSVDSAELASRPGHLFQTHLQAVGPPG